MDGGQAHWRRRLRSNLPRQFIQPFFPSELSAVLLLSFCADICTFGLNFFAAPKLAYLTAHLDKTRFIKILEEETITGTIAPNAVILTPFFGGKQCCLQKMFR